MKGDEANFPAAVMDARRDNLDWEYIRRWALPDESAWLEEVCRSTDEQLVRHMPWG